MFSMFFFHYIFVLIQTNLCKWNDRLSAGAQLSNSVWLGFMVLFFPFRFFVDVELFRKFVRTLSNVYKERRQPRWGPGDGQLWLEMIEKWIGQFPQFVSIEGVHFLLSFWSWSTIDLRFVNLSNFQIWYINEKMLWLPASFIKLQHCITAIPSWSRRWRQNFGHGQHLDPVVVPVQTYVWPPESAIVNTNQRGHCHPVKIWDWKIGNIHLKVKKNHFQHFRQNFKISIFAIPSWTTKQPTFLHQK